MINRFSRVPRRRLIAVVVLAATVTFAWYAAQPIYPACTVFSGAYVPAGASASDRDAAYRQAYEQALADGACGPSHARFRDWTG
ncbi:hypothetical protein ACFWAN_37825 [Streptomyces mirabilis]|uniref:hypothetical protein n=1 Tax=Streptomyces mirabilis TaxID=68239 RepID=UPI0033A45735